MGFTFVIKLTEIIRFFFRGITIYWSFPENDKVFNEPSVRRSDYGDSLVKRFVVHRGRSGSNGREGRVTGSKELEMFE